MLWRMVIAVVPLTAVLGCKNLLTANTILVGGERVMFYPAGKTVPEVPAEANTNGWYSLTADELKAMMQL